MLASPSRRNGQDILAGLLFTGFGAAGLWFGADLPIGSLARMGAGFLPTALSIVLLGVGAWLLISGLRTPGNPAPPFNLRATTGILGAAALFGLIVEEGGIVLAVAVLVAVSAAASIETRWREVPFLAAGLAIIVVLVFVTGLGMLLPLWPR